MNKSQFGNGFPIKKLAILTVFTYGFYYYIWQYRNWKLIKLANKSDIRPGWRTVGQLIPFLNIYLLYEQFSDIKKLAEREKIDAAFGPGKRTAVFFLMQGFYLGFISFLPLTRIQEVFNMYWARIDPDKPIKTAFSFWETVLTIIGGLILLIIIYSVFFTS